MCRVVLLYVISAWINIIQRPCIFICVEVFIIDFRPARSAECPLRAAARLLQFHYCTVAAFVGNR